MIKKIYTSKEEAINTAKDIQIFSKQKVRVVKLAFEDAYKIETLPAGNIENNFQASGLLLSDQFSEIIWPKN